MIVNNIAYEQVLEYMLSTAYIEEPNKNRKQFETAVIHGKDIKVVEIYQTAEAAREGHQNWRSAIHKGIVNFEELINVVENYELTEDQVENVKRTTPEGLSVTVMWRDYDFFLTILDEINETLVHQPSRELLSTALDNIKMRADDMLIVARSIEHLQDEIDRLAKKTGIPRSFLAKQALDHLHGVYDE